jgi:hypothetical protein
MESRSSSKTGVKNKLSIQSTSKADESIVFENVMAQIHHRIEIQCKMKLKYHRDRILSLQIFLTLIGVSSHQPLLGND